MTFSTDWRNPGQAPTEGPLVDTLGRVAGDLRISVIDKCNLRCTYCMPAEGLPWLGRDEILTVLEIERLARLFHSLGVREFKITGGEPGAPGDRRPDLRARPGPRRPDDHPRAAARPPGRTAVRRRVTGSYDSLLRHRYQEMTRRDALARMRRAWPPPGRPASTRSRSTAW
ncbi:radical SAM protein [Kitasatospora sp. NPDC008050]|uniref:radical SAM protein n=1 Tax=Kitasatospora sp. NPDC008050 TaxID=3364021 RepID=UPI0036E6FFAA